MNTATRVAAAAATGYILGRRKKLKLAIAVGSMLAGKRLATDPRGMLRQAGDFVESRPELAQLTDQVRTTLFTAARGAATGAVSQRIDRLSDSIRDRSDRLTGAVTERVPAGRSGEETAEEGEVQEREEPRGARRSRRGEDEAAAEEGEVQEREEPRGARRSRRGDDEGEDEQSRPRKRAAKKAPAKRASSERGETPARKRTAKKATSGRSRSGSRG